MTKLYRSNRDKKLFGLCGGLAELFNIDATILRLVVAIGVVFSGGTVLLLYIVACLVIPKEPELYGGGSQQGFTGGFYHQAPPVQSRPTQPPSVHHQAAPQGRPDSGIDDMMKDIEKKAMKKEIEELKARLAQLEKGE